jgi:hypothetical protein
VVSSDTVLREEDDLSTMLAGHSPMVSLEKLSFVKEMILRENCFDFVLLVGHDCCGFFRTMVALWKNTGVMSTGSIIVLLQDNALPKNCVNCIAEVSSAENLNEIWIVKKGKILRHSKKFSFGGKTLRVRIEEYKIFVLLKS